ncbi:MAG: hypothetical protein WC389_12975, partial [Lutibacter sp.]
MLLNLLYLSIEKLGYKLFVLLLILSSCITYKTVQIQVPAGECVNLLDSARWDYQCPWGNIVDPNNEYRMLTIKRSLVRWDSNKVSFSVCRCPSEEWTM